MKPKRSAEWKMHPSQTWLKFAPGKSPRTMCLPNTWKEIRSEAGTSLGSQLLALGIFCVRTHFRGPSPRARNSCAAWNQSSSGDPSGQPLACHIA